MRPRGRPSVLVAAPAVLAALLMASSCSTDASADRAGVGSPSTTTSTATSTTVQAEAAVPVLTSLDAEALAKQLAAKVPTMRLGTVYTDSTDPNGLLGQPDGYSSKAAFADKRVKRLSPGEGVEQGGLVEVFATPAAAAQRRAYIESIIGVGGMAASERLYLHGAALLRLSGELAPSAATTYAKVWTSLP